MCGRVQGAARLLADLNLAPNALRWWEKCGVGIIGKGTCRSFVSPWVSDCHALVEGGTSVRRGGPPLLQLNVPSGSGSNFALELHFPAKNR